jgi:C4-dicarboxylate-specific signal transduction histidine kinase
MIWLGIKYGFAAVAILLLFVQALLIFALSYFKIDNTGFTVFQTLMFIMASTGQLLGAVFTEREHAARALRHQRAELARVSSQATTAAMAVTMAHEISQPLSSLSSYVHSARRMIDGGRPMESIRNALEKAESESRRTRDIIERIRNFVSSGRLAFERTDLDEIARKIVMLNVDEARSRGIELVGDFDEATPDVVADRIAVEQALNNLVTNAIEASAERIDRSGVGPERRSGRVLVRLRRHANRVVLQVDDDGPGVAPDIEEKMFEVFETTKPGGMGLGLPLTLQIARKHSGRLEWRPLKPHGSSFLMELPIDGPQDDAR